MRTLVGLVVLLSLAAGAPAVFAAMSSTSYQIPWDTVSTGGGDTSSSASYGLRDSSGNQAIGGGTSTTYDLRAGYRQGVFDEFLTFDVYAQLTSSGRTATSVAGTTISASESGISTGDFVALVQDVGASQVAAIGQVSSVGVGSIVVDRWTDAGVFPTIDGTNDMVYRLSGSAPSFGTFSATTVQTAILATQVSVDVPAGYTVSVFDDGDLRNGSTTISDVVDGTVSVGSSEYGARSSDASLASSTFDTQDTALTTSPQAVVTTSNPTFDDRAFLTLKAAISASQASGSYAHQVSLVVSANY